MTTPATPFEPSNGVPNNPLSRLSDIKERRDASLLWMKSNYWDEFSEVYRAIKCRTKPIMVQDKKTGNKVEDLNRTNVCMPELSLAVRRKTARLTSNPPTLNYYVPGEDNDFLADRLSSRAYYEYDRSGEAQELRRMVHMAITFGAGYCKTFYDQVTIEKQVRYLRERLTDRRHLMKLQGAGMDETESAVQSKGDTVGQDEIAQSIAEHGKELQAQVPTTMYEGPVMKARFIGDIVLEPGCLTMNDSYYVGESYTESDLWLKKKVNDTYKDPESGEDVAVFDAKAVESLYDSDPSLPKDKLYDLKRELRLGIQQIEPKLERRLLPGKKFDIFEYHAPDKYGKLWIEYIGNDREYLGRQPYPYDLGGRFTFSEFVPWPDLIGAIGDSSPRLLRFLHSMHNAAVGQRNDLITNILRRTYIVESEEDIPDEVIERKGFRIIVARAHGFRPLEEPDVPQSAWETEAQIKSEMQIAEPAIGGSEAAGTNFNPQSGKTATTALLQAKSSDALVQFEIESLNLTLKDIGEKKLEIHKQLATEPIKFPNRKQYVKSEALSQRFGKTAEISIDPYEIQDPLITVEPVAGSTLAVDDELRTSKIMQVYSMAESDPQTWNKREAGRLVLSTIKGVGDTSKLINPDPGPQPPAIKVSMNVAAKLEDQPADIKAQIMTAAGLQVSPDTMLELQHGDTIKGVQAVSKAADAASNLEQPVHPVADVTPGQNAGLQKKINGIA